MTSNTSRGWPTGTGRRSVYGGSTDGVGQGGQWALGG